MANIKSIGDTNDARLQSASTTGQRTKTCSVNMNDVIDENDVVMMQGEDEDNDDNSISSTMGVRASSFKDCGNRTRSISHRRDRTENHASNDAITAAGNTNFFLPLPLQAPRTVDQQGQHQHTNRENSNRDDDDDISTLTEYSMEEHDDDNISQTTATTTWTFVTDATGSTIGAAPPKAATHRPNFAASDTMRRGRRRTLANKRTRMQHRQESSANPILFRENRNGTCRDQWKRRRKS